MRVASPQIKQEPSHDGAHVDSYHSMSEALQTVSFAKLHADSCFLMSLTFFFLCASEREREREKLNITNYFLVSYKFLSQQQQMVDDGFSASIAVYIIGSCVCMCLISSFEVSRLATCRF